MQVPRPAVPLRTEVPRGSLAGSEDLSARIGTVTAVGLVLLLSAAATWLLPPRQTQEVAVPADVATPERVVAAYTAALDAHDCDTAEALTAPGTDPASWCEDVAGLAGVRIGEATPERPEWSGHAAGVEVVHVPVRFDLDWRPLRDDGSLDEGSTTWGYLLVRDAQTAPWRIAGQGPA